MKNPFWWNEDSERRLKLFRDNNPTFEKYESWEKLFRFWKEKIREQVDLQSIEYAYAINFEIVLSEQKLDLFEQEFEYDVIDGHPVLVLVVLDEEKIFRFSCLFQMRKQTKEEYQRRKRNGKYQPCWWNDDSDRRLQLFEKRSPFHNNEPEFWERYEEKIKEKMRQGFFLEAEFGCFVSIETAMEDCEEEGHVFCAYRPEYDVIDGHPAFVLVTDDGENVFKCNCIIQFREESVWNGQKE